MSQPPPGPTSELLRALASLVRVLNEQETDYALIGGLGVSVRGPVRATRDIDMLISIPQVQLPGLLESVTDNGFQVDVFSAIRTWNEDHLLGFAYGSVQVDWIKAVLPVFSRVLGRAQWEEVVDTKIRVADAEGLILLKLISFRPRDQEDIRGILAANPGLLDLDWVRSEWSNVTSDDDPRTEQFEQFVKDFYRDT